MNFFNANPVMVSMELKLLLKMKLGNKS